MNSRTVIVALVAISHAGGADAQTYYGRQVLRAPMAQAAPPQPPAWTVGDWSQWSSGCSDGATRVRAVTCRRGPAVVADADCGVAGRPTSTETAGILSGCSFAWRTAGWSGPSTTCGIGVRTRAVWCERSDGTAVADDACAAPKPAATQPSTDYTTCGYSTGEVVAHDAWTSTCSAAARRTEHHACLRSDGTVVADAECTSRGVALTSTSDFAAVYTGCSYDWNVTTGSCVSDSARARTSQCCRTGDGTNEAVADSLCVDAGKPKPSATYADATCAPTDLIVDGTFEAGKPAWSASSSNGRRISGGAGVVHSGSWSFNMMDGVQQTIATTAGRKYQIRFWYVGGGNLVKLEINSGGWTQPYIDRSTTSSWKQATVTWTATAASSVLLFTGYGTSYLDDVSVTPAP